MRASRPTLATTLVLAAAVALPAQAQQSGRERSLAPATTDLKSWSADSQGGTYTVETFATGLANPWSVALLPDGSFLVTERGGNLRRVSSTGTVSAPLTGLPAIAAGGQGGLLDVALSPDFATDNTIFFSYSEAGANATAGTAIARAVLGPTSISGVQVIYRQLPKLNGGNHFGSRLAFAPDGKLFATMGERFDRIRAQKLDMGQGKVIRINTDGTIPRDNPMHTPKVQRSIYSYGHRNPQSLAIDPRSGKLWEGEHGPQGGDEINIIERGGNYGWPLTSYGNDYGTGQPYPEWIGTTAPGIIAPIRHWVPTSPALSGMAFFVNRPTSSWNNSLFVGMLARARLARLTLVGDTITGEELINLGPRIRDVRVAADGRLYVLSDESNGRLFRITPPPA